MAIDLEHLRRHYADLSDEALMEVDASDLVDAARRCWEDEVARRKPAHKPAPVTRRSGQEGPGEAEDWIESAACVATFTQSYAGDSVAERAEAAREALEASGIPCQLVEEILEDASTGQPRQQVNVMAPGAMNLFAASVLDREIFNPKLEEEWRGHLAELSDADLARLSPDIVCAGLLDRVERLRRAWEEELERRGQR
jgi:hypothetical protein